MMRDKRLDYPALHCDETRVQVLKELGRDPGSQSWMWVQTGGPPDKPVILFDYTGAVCGSARRAATTQPVVPAPQTMKSKFRSHG